MIDLASKMLPAPVNGGFRMEGYWVWCGSAIKGEDGRYHLFASRWKKTQPMHPGWLFGSEIVRAVSDRPEGPYTFQEVVLTARGQQYWDGMSVHNPHITRQGDTYVLYYIGTTYPFPAPKDDDKVQHDDLRTDVARANKRVGIATAPSVFGPWTRRDAPILTPRPDHFDNMFTSNPAPCVGPDGSVTMVYKSRGVLPGPDYPGGHIHGPMVFGTAAAPSWEGPYTARSEQPLFAGDTVLEDPFIWRDADGLHMIAKDMYGNICGEQYGGVYAHSQDGLSWQMERGRLAYSRHVLWDDGVTRLMGNLDRPFILFEEGKPICLFFATSNGTDSFMDATDTWNLAIPLRP